MIEKFSFVCLLVAFWIIKVEKPIVTTVNPHLVSGEKVGELLHLFMVHLGFKKLHQLEKVAIDTAFAKSSALDQKAVRHVKELIEKAKAEGQIFGDQHDQKETARKMEEREGEERKRRKKEEAVIDRSY